MELPRISRLSGTHPEDLFKDTMLALDAVQKATEATAGLWPNGRDYQGGDIRKAMHEHAERVKHLRQVAAELQTIAEGIQNQMGE